MMRYDPYTGDYGPNFFGHAINTGTFVTHDDAMGWICFGGNVEERHGVVHTTVLDSSRDRLFLAPVGLWITLDAGKIVSADFDTRKQTVTLHLAPATKYVSDARMRVRETEAGAGGWTVVSAKDLDAGETVVALGSGETAVVLHKATM
jgi:hypothetical protein